MFNDLNGIFRIATLTIESNTVLILFLTGQLFPCLKRDHYLKNGECKFQIPLFLYPAQLRFTGGIGFIQAFDPRPNRRIL